MYRVWDYVRQNDEVEKLKKKIANLETRNEELHEQLTELRRNIEPLPIPWRENGIFSQDAKNQLLQRINGLVYPQHCKDINLLVIGMIGSGKSSLINTLFTVLRNNGQLATIAPSADNYTQSTTNKLHEIVLQNIAGTKKLRVYDCRGIKKEEQIKIDVFKEDLKKVIDGHVMKDYEFNKRRTIQEDSDFFRNKPTISDKMHCVLFVVNAFTLNRQTDFGVLRWMQHHLFSKNIPSRIILSHVDTLDMCVYGDLTKLFVSRHVQNKVQLAKEIFHLQDIQILPIANYVEGITQNISQDILALQAVENILNETISSIENLV